MPRCAAMWLVVTLRSPWVLNSARLSRTIRSRVLGRWAIGWIFLQSVGTASAKGTHREGAGKHPLLPAGTLPSFSLGCRRAARQASYLTD
ncbi:hypothetical protein D3C84_861630 [compost metagenome]